MQAAQKEEFWTAIESELLACLRDKGPMAPAELGRRLGMSAAGAASLTAMLATDGKVRICLVELEPLCETKVQ
jgi:hypothetical protein